MCGIGELTGPLATGLSMEYLGAPRFVLSRIVTLAANVLRIVAIRRRTVVPILTISSDISVKPEPPRRPAVDPRRFAT